MTEELKQKAKDFVSKRASGTSKEMDYYADILTEFATEATKELQEELDYAKNNCLFSDCDRVVRLKSQIAELEEQIEKICV